MASSMRPIFCARTNSRVGTEADIAERAEQHPAFDGSRADASPPAQAVDRGRQLDPTHEAAQPDLGDRGMGSDAVVEQCP